MKTPYALLALIGGTLVLISIYFQANSMDFERYTLSQYFVADTAMYVWWTAIAFPFLVGLSFLIIAAVCVRVRPNRQVTIRVLVVCFTLAILLCLVNVGWGVYAAVSMLVPLFLAVRHRPSQSA